MYKYLDIINLSIFLTCLYIVISNVNRNKLLSQTITNIIMITTIILLKSMFILKILNQDKFNYVEVINNIIILILLIKLEINNINKKNKFKLRLRYIVHFICFGQLFIQLFNGNIISKNINSVLGFIFSTYILFKFFKIYIKDTYDKNNDILSKINRSFINLKIHREKLKKNKEINNEIYKIIYKKEYLLDLILKKSKKCIFLVDDKGYMINRDSSFYEVWKEYSEYDIDLNLFCKNSFKDNEKILDNIYKCKNINKSIDDEIEDKYGRIFNFRCTPVNLNDHKNGVICIMTDISLNKNIEAKIKNNNTKYKKIIDNIPYSILITNKNKILYDNKKNKFIDFNKEDIKNRLLNNNCMKELNCTCENGINICLNVDKVDYSEDDEFRNIFFLRDITKYRNLLSTIESSKKKCESILDIISEGIYILNLENRVLEYANNSFLNIMKIKDLSDVNIDNISTNIISENTNDKIEYKRKVIKNKSGQAINVECGEIILNINNQLKMIGIVRDITEQIKIESIKQNIEEQEKLNKSKNEFFINMSHELKTPLNLIHSSNQLLDVVYKEDLKINNRIDILDIIDVVKKNTNMLMALVDNIIDISKLQANFYETKKDYFNIVDVSENIVDEFSNFLNREKINIIFDTDEEEKIVNIDPDDIERAILILLSMVVKYSIKNSTILFDLGSKNDYITITIKNIDGYDYDKYIKDSERNILDLGITLSKLIINLYDGEVLLQMNNNSIETVIAIKQDCKNKEYKERSKSLNESYIHSEYRKICSL